MAKDNIDRLYECYQILDDAKDKIEEHEDEYLQILNSVKGENKEKTLAAQFIPCFFGGFPKLREKALDALLDLVEDADISIRKQAIKNLPSICKFSNTYIPKVSDILTQMLQCEDTSELSVVNFSLAIVMKLDLKGTLAGIFTQIVATDDEIVRKRAIGFICAKLKSFPEEIVTKEIEEFVLQQCKKVFQDVTDEEFSTFMSLLSSFKLSKTIPGQIKLVEIIMEQAELDKGFSYDTPDNTLCLLQCIRQAIPFFTLFVSSAPFVKFIVLQVLPVLKNLASLVEEIDASLEVIKLLAESSPFSHKLEEPEMCLEKLLDCLIIYLPSPPAEAIDSEKLINEMNWEFTYIECLLFTFHQLSKQYPDFLISEKNTDRFKDLKTRLQYLAMCIQAGVKSLRESLTAGKDKPKDEDSKVKNAALRTMTNISALIKDFFHNPPSYKTVVILSWKPLLSSASKKSTDTILGAKRKEILAPTDNSKQQKLDKSPRQIYAPPGGKYSSNVKKYYPSGGYYNARGRGRGRFY